ncbi:SH3 domain-containing protein [Clostridium sp. DSM 8431]|uniref:L,D-transpeptidase family protein n=1 Tax=Clostridium sp. DSM 8431 TaxID=1761781 RepID=UPI0008F23A85|nr:L,D-transpeptidase family protein [Clostridium sp. DSM 8431]SFU86185.1 SH3 domain-containing protein [Clostridium sp. DSM 8431]
MTGIRFHIHINGKEGFLESDYLTKSQYPWSNVNLRKAPSLSSEKILVVPKKDRVEVFEKKGDFSRVIYNDKEGFIYNYYLSDDGNNNKTLNYKNFRTNPKQFIIDNEINSSSKYILITDLNNKLTYIFENVNNVWNQKYRWSCTVGKKSTSTIKGIFFISGRKPGFGTDEYSVKYATRIQGGYYYHSVLYNSSGTYIIDGRLGMALSHGCIRLKTESAKWIYDNISDGTKVIID